MSVFLENDFEEHIELESFVLGGFQLFYITRREKITGLCYRFQRKNRKCAEMVKRSCCACLYRKTNSKLLESFVL